MIRGGGALLAGLVVCGRCEVRMRTWYPGEGQKGRYGCVMAYTALGEPSCQGVMAPPLDEEVVRLALLALAPAALEVSLRVAADLHQQQEQAEAQWRQRLERARYEADRARRQYDRVEPENRLVARTLEAAWEEKLRDYRGLEEQHQRFLQEQPCVLTPAEQAQIRRLASDLPALWQAATTTDVDRKRILRQIIDKVMVNVDRDSEWAEARVHWVGGHQTYTRFRRPVARLEQLSTWAQVRQRIAALKAEGRTVPEMVEQLNREGLRPPNQKSFTVASVRTWLSRYGLTKARRPARQLGLKRHECLLADLAVELDVSYQTIYAWIRGGRLKARQVGGRHGQWVVHADAAVRSKLRAAKRRSKKDTTSDGGARSGGARRSPKV